jgi:outer membrane biosynthesis protein TonB
MTSRAVSSLLVTVSLGLGLAACSTEPRSDNPAPVIDRSVVPGAPTPVETTEPPPLPQVRVQPLPRPLPLESGQPPPQPQMSMTPKPKPKPKPKPPEEVATALPPLEPPPKAAEPPAEASAAAPAAAPAPAPAPKREVVLPPAEITPKGNQAVVALLDSAKQYVARSDWDKAAAALERAVRLEPKNAGIWHDLAQIRLQQRQYKQAEDLAAKSNSLAGSDRQVKSRNWKVISVSRRARGDDSGAEAAEAQASVEK